MYTVKIDRVFGVASPLASAALKRPGKKIVAPEEPSGSVPIAAVETFIASHKGTAMSTFTADQLYDLLSERQLAGLAAVGKNGTPHVASVGWAYEAEHDTIDIGGHSLERTKKTKPCCKTDAPPLSSTT